MAAPLIAHSTHRPLPGNPRPSGSGTEPSGAVGVGSVSPSLTAAAALLDTASTMLATAPVRHKPPARARTVPVPVRGVSMKPAAASAPTVAAISGAVASSTSRRRHRLPLCLRVRRRIATQETHSNRRSPLLSTRSDGQQATATPPVSAANKSREHWHHDTGWSPYRRRGRGCAAAGRLWRSAGASQSASLTAGGGVGVPQSAELAPAANKTSSSGTPLAAAVDPGDAASVDPPAMVGEHAAQRPLSPIAIEVGLAKEDVGGPFG